MKMYFRFMDGFQDEKYTLKTESEVINFAESYAKRMNEESSDDESLNKISVNSFDEAIDVLESANVYMVEEDKDNKN